MVQIRFEFGSIVVILNTIIIIYICLSTYVPTYIPFNSCMHYSYPVIIINIECMHIDKRERDSLGVYQIIIEA